MVEQIGTEGLRIRGHGRLTPNETESHIPSYSSVVHGHLSSTRHGGGTECRQIGMPGPEELALQYITFQSSLLSGIHRFQKLLRSKKANNWGASLRLLARSSAIFL